MVTRDRVIARAVDAGRRQAERWLTQRGEVVRRDELGRSPAGAKTYGPPYVAAVVRCRIDDGPGIERVLGPRFREDASVVAYVPVHAPVGIQDRFRVNGKEYDVIGMGQDQTDALLWTLALKE